MGEAPLPQRARGYRKTWVSVGFGELEKLLEAERAQLPPWLVVGFGAGIAAWFVLDARNEWSAFVCIAAALALVGFVLGKGRTGRALGWFALAATIGCCCWCDRMIPACLLMSEFRSTRTNSRRASPREPKSG
jgi:competence protein ComEC